MSETPDTQAEAGVLCGAVSGGRRRHLDTRTTPLLTLRRTVFWAESVADPWEVVPTTPPTPGDADE